MSQIVEGDLSQKRSFIGLKPDLQKSLTSTLSSRFRRSPLISVEALSEDAPATTSTTTAVTSKASSGTLTTSPRGDTHIYSTSSEAVNDSSTLSHYSSLSPRVIAQASYKRVLGPVRSEFKSELRVTAPNKFATHSEEVLNTPSAGEGSSAPTLSLGGRVSYHRLEYECDRYPGSVRIAAKAVPAVGVEGLISDHMGKRHEVTSVTTEAQRSSPIRIETVPTSSLGSISLPLRYKAQDRGNISLPLRYKAQDHGNVSMPLRYKAEDRGQSLFSSTPAWDATRVLPRFETHEPSTLNFNPLVKSGIDKSMPAAVYEASAQQLPELTFDGRRHTSKTGLMEHHPGNAPSTGLGTWTGIKRVESHLPTVASQYCSSESAAVYSSAASSVTDQRIPASAEDVLNSLASKHFALAEFRDIFDEIVAVSDEIIVEQRTSTVDSPASFGAHQSKTRPAAAGTTLSAFISSFGQKDRHHHSRKDLRQVSTGRSNRGSCRHKKHGRDQPISPWTIVITSAPK